jgi:hypothetical protein
MDPLGGEHVPIEQGDERRQRRGAGPDPVGQSRDAEVEALARKPLALAIERLMLAEFSVHDGR